MKSTFLLAFFVAAASLELVSCKSRPIIAACITPNPSCTFTPGSMPFKTPAVEATIKAPPHPDNEEQALINEAKSLTELKVSQDDITKINEKYDCAVEGNVVKLTKKQAKVKKPGDSKATAKRKLKGSLRKMNLDRTGIKVEVLGEKPNKYIKATCPNGKTVVEVRKKAA